MSRLRLAAACALLKLAQEPCYHEIITLEQYQLCALVINVRTCTSVLLSCRAPASFRHCILIFAFVILISTKHSTIVSRWLHCFFLNKIWYFFIITDLQYWQSITCLMIWLMIISSHHHLCLSCPYFSSSSGWVLPGATVLRPEAPPRPVPPPPSSGVHGSIRAVR